MESVWTDTTKLPQFKSLNHDTKTDVLIIGGGMAGLLCAYMLQQKGINYILAEGGRICSGITKNTTAKITSQHGIIYNKLIHEFGAEKAQMYYLANENALTKFREIAATAECDFERKSSFVYSLDNYKKIEKEMTAIQKLGIKAKFTDCLSVPFSVVGAIEFEKQAQFNPLKFAGVIAKDLNIYENTPIRELIGLTALTDKHKIQANIIIVATHFPFLNKHGSYFLKLYQHRSYVCAFENASELHGMYIDENETGMSFRNYKDLLLIGGGGHRTGKKGDAWHEIEKFTKQHYPNSKEKYRWAAQDCMSLDKVPYIGHYSDRTNNLLVATGFNKWGMCSSMVSAMILTDIVCGKENPFSSVFSPSRTILRPQLAVNAFETTKNLLTFGEKRCPHLGCTLKWNSQEQSWDCPCHGSRFDKSGHVIDNPATGDLKNI